MQMLKENNINFGKEWSLPYSTGTLLPFFYEDKKRTFFVSQQIVLFERGKRETENNGENIKIAELSYTDIVRIIEEVMRTGKLPDIIAPFFEEGKTSTYFQIKVLLISIILMFVFLLNNFISMALME